MATVHVDDFLLRELEEYGYKFEDNKAHVDLRTLIEMSVCIKEIDTNAATEYHDNVQSSGSDVFFLSRADSSTKSY